MDKLVKIFIFVKTAWIYVSGLITFGIACALSKNNEIDSISFIALLTVSLYTLEKNRSSK